MIIQNLDIKYNLHRYENKFKIITVHVIITQYIY